MSVPDTSTQLSNAQRRAQLRTAMETRMQEKRQRPLPTWLASRSGRRTLSLVPAATFTVGVLAAAVGDTIAGAFLGLSVAILGASGILLLRRATLMLDTAPENLLDEREIGERDQAYRRGFQLTLTLLGTLMLLAALDAFLTKTTTTELFTGAGWITLTIASFLTVSMLPSAALAWNWSAPVDDPDD